MTDYAKHIAELETTGRLDMYPEEREALTAAIELMRAATPKDAEAEREYCERFANEWLNGGDGPNLEESVEAERAAARAEGYAQQEDAIRKCETAIAEEMCETSRLSVQLSAAQAEIERLRAACDRAATVLKGVNTSARNQCLGALIGVDEPEYLTASASLQTKLTERDSEIERLRGEVAGMRLDFDLISREHTTKVQELNDEANQLEAAEYALTAKLDALRAAAERWLRERDDVEGWMRAAIEASR